MNRKPVYRPNVWVLVAVLVSWVLLFLICYGFYSLLRKVSESGSPF